MNETSWLSCTDPSVLLRSRERDLSERKLRLFACACTRRVWPLLTREAVRNAILTAERFADGEANRDELLGGWRAVRKALSVTPLGTRWEDALMAALNSTSDSISSYTAGSAARSAALALDIDWRQRHAHSERPADKERLRSGSPDEHAYQCRVFRDLIPFRPVEIDPAWLAWGGNQVTALAQTIHDEQRWQDLPVLADALEEAGCTDQKILGHCRPTRPETGQNSSRAEQAPTHARGCWLLDQLLGLE
jgi:hypothetical protein